MQRQAEINQRRCMHGRTTRGILTPNEVCNLNG